MQAAKLSDQLFARLEVQVVRIAEHDLGADFGEFARIDALDGAERADGHEDRGLHGAVDGLERPCARQSIRGVDGERAGRGHTITIASPNE